MSETGSSFAKIDFSIVIKCLNTSEMQFEKKSTIETTQFLTLL